MKYPKTPRLFRDVVITEKLDGTNAGITIQRFPINGPVTQLVQAEGGAYAIQAQSRNRLIYPDDDNFGFAEWVSETAEGLVTTLGEGTHFGEWYGEGIQKNPHEIEGRRFALFNVKRWAEADLSAVPGLEIVPPLYAGPFSEVVVRSLVESLGENGSLAKGGGDFHGKAEGVIVYHTASGQVFKVLCEHDEIPKGLVPA